MIENRDFELTEAELLQLNAWSTQVAKEMCATETESWAISVTFSFSNTGTMVEASSGCLPCNRVTIREE
jgi:nicotinamide mononucleotide (NMN) deamidase PncC